MQKSQGEEVPVTTSLQPNLKSASGTSKKLKKATELSSGQSQSKAAKSSSKRVSLFLGLEIPDTLQKEKSEKIQQTLHRAIVYKDFLNILNYSNRLIVSSVQVPGHFAYKAFISRGNNGVLVKGVLKNRWWWQHAEPGYDMNDIQLLWTQYRKLEFVKYMKPNQQDLILDKIQNQIADEENAENHLRNEGSDKKLGQEKLRPVSSKTSRKPDTKIRVSLEQQQHLSRVLNPSDLEKVIKYYSRSSKQSQLRPPYITDAEKDAALRYIKIDRTSTFVKYKEPVNYKLHNHLGNNFHLANKNALMYNMKHYYGVLDLDPFQFIPQTYHVREGEKDKEFQRFKEAYQAYASQASKSEAMRNNWPEDSKQPKPHKLMNVWIIKPGEGTNRGTGIEVMQEYDQIRATVNQKELHCNGVKKTYIIQKYIERPLLYNKRKFDIRCFVLTTFYNNHLKAYWYSEGYVRTASNVFTLKNLDNKFIHLTNDAIQKKSEDYGKFENGNKISYNELQKYIEQLYKKDFYDAVYPKLRKIALDTIKAVFMKLEPQKRAFSFELFGLDFMVDEDLHVWLIEVNSNPCLECTGSLLSRIIPNLIENVFRIAVDPMFPPPNWSKNKPKMIPDNLLENNKFELFFDELLDGPYLRSLFKKKAADEQFEKECKQQEELNENPDQTGSQEEDDETDQ